MPISLNAVKVLKELDKEDIRILQMIEVLLKEGEYAPLEKIAKYAGFTVKETNYRLSKIHKLKLIERWKGHYIGYTLKFAGFDALALNALYEGGIISSVGSSRGVGKESDIYYALDFEGNEVIIKINRTGRASFRNVKKKRDFLEKRTHYSIYFTAYLSARREYEILSKLQGSKLPVPKIRGYNRHIIVMDIIKGKELVNIDYIEKPLKVLKQIIKFERKLYKKYKLIHADLTEYNIIYDEDSKKITIIDFPQAVTIDHPNALELLERDVNHLMEFFGKKYGVSLETDSVLKFITK